MIPKESPEKTSPQAEELPRTNIFDWYLSVPYLILFVGTMVFMDLVQRIVLLFGQKLFYRHTIFTNRILVKIMRVTGARFRKELKAPVTAEEPLIIISNHQSLMDIPVLYGVFGSHRLRFAAKRELTRWVPYVSFNLRHGNHVIIDRTDGSTSVRNLERIGNELRENKGAVVMFPEGTRARHGTLKKFKKAGVTMLLKSCPDAVIQPVVLDGLWKFASKKLMPVPRCLVLSTCVLPPRKLAAGESVDAFMEKIEAEMRAELQRLRTRES